MFRIPRASALSGLLVPLLGVMCAAPLHAATDRPPQDTSRTGSVTGRILWNDKGVDSVAVRLCGLEPSKVKGITFGLRSFDGCVTERMSLTGADGTYTFADVGTGEFLVMAKSDDMWVFHSAGPNVAYIKISGATVRASTLKVVADKQAVAASIALMRGLELVSPIRGAQVDDPRPFLRWEAIEGATRYRVSLHAATLSAFSRHSLRRPPVFHEQVVSTNEFQVPRALGSCTFLWWVEAFNAGGTKLAESWNYYRTTERAPEDIGYFVMALPTPKRDPACP